MANACVENRRVRALRKPCLRYAKIYGLWPVDGCAIGLLIAADLASLPPKTAHFLRVH